MILMEEFIVLALNDVSTRSRLLAWALESPLIQIRSPPPYVDLVPKLSRIISRYKPRKVVVQLPVGPMLFSVLVVKRLVGGFKVIADTHTGFYTGSMLTRHGLLNAPFRGLLRYVDLILLHNELNKSFIGGLNDKAMVLYDPFYVIEGYVGENGNCSLDEANLGNHRYVVYPVSWHPDEPIEWIVKAWGNIETDTRLVLTGRPDIGVLKKIIQYVHRGNVILTGYLDVNDYYCLLARSEFIITATMSHLDMQCSAYEALALRKPILASDTAALKLVLRDSAVYFDYDMLSLRNAIRVLEDNLDLYKARITERSVELKEEVLNSIKALKNL